MAQPFEKSSFLLEIISPSPAIHDNYHLLMCFGSLYCKQYGPRSEQKIRNTYSCLRQNVFSHARVMVIGFRSDLKSNRYKKRLRNSIFYVTIDIKGQ